MVMVKGSRSFGSTQEHRKNFINWSINQLNFNNIKELRLEEIVNIGYNKKRKSRFLSHWCNTLIRDKITKRCEEEEVLLNLQSSPYRSQRCSTCGLVRRSNRKGKTYTCSNCGLIIDADYNASLNHQQDLCFLSTGFRRLNYNIQGFYWKGEGCYSLTGEALTVPLSGK